MSLHLVCRRAKFEASLLMNQWKVNYDDIEPLKGTGKKGGSTVSRCHLFIYLFIVLTCYFVISDI